MENGRKFKPSVIETKQQLLTALKNGVIKSSKYNLLNEDQKSFVELVVFADYTPEQAIRAMKPGLSNPRVVANRLASDPEVSATLEELSILKDRSFMSEIVSAEKLALEKLKYIMMTTSDPALAAACAKTILDTAGKVIQSQIKKEEKSDGVTMHIVVDQINVTPTKDFIKEDPVIIPLTEEEIQKIEDEKIAMSKKAKVNPNTGLNFDVKFEETPLESKAYEEATVIVDYEE